MSLRSVFFCFEIAFAYYFIPFGWWMKNLFTIGRICVSLSAWNNLSYIILVSCLLLVVYGSHSSIIITNNCARRHALQIRYECNSNSDGRQWYWQSRSDAQIHIIFHQFIHRPKKSRRKHLWRAYFSGRPGGRSVGSLHMLFCTFFCSVCLSVSFSPLIYIIYLFQYLP